MNIFKFFIFSFSFFILCSCSNNREPLPRTKIVKTENIVVDNGAMISIITEHDINGGVIYNTDNYLNVVSRSHTAAAVGLKIAQFATSFFTGGATYGFTKEDLNGSYIESVPNTTMDYLTPELYKILKKIHLNKQKENSITIKPFKFKLIYDGLTDDKYNFVYKTFISSGDFNFVCSDNDLDVNDKLKPVSEWENDNYQLVQNSALKAINTCIKRLNSNEELIKLESALK